MFKTWVMPRSKRPDGPGAGRDSRPTEEVTLRSSVGVLQSHWDALLDDPGGGGDFLIDPHRGSEISRSRPSKLSGVSATI